MTAKALNDLNKDVRDEFLRDLWEWLLDRRLLVPVEIVQRYGRRSEKINIDGSPHQVNVDKIGIRETAARHQCGVCRRSHITVLPSAACPEYSCKGTTDPCGRDEENYDVVQFTRTAFVPMRSYEHSAQVPKLQREKVEKGFKAENGGYNVIVATPTLRLGNVLNEPAGRG